MSEESKKTLGAGKILALIIIWVGASAILRFVTGSHWGLCVVGGLGAASLTLSFWLPDDDKAKSDKASAESESEPAAEKPAE